MTLRTPHTLLDLRFEGPTIRDGRILYTDLSQFLSGFHAAIERTIRVLETGTSVRIGRPTRAAQILSALEVVATGRGSFRFRLGLRRDAPLLPGFDLGEDAIRKLLSDLESIGHDDAGVEIDQGVLMALREAGRVFDRGIDAIHITPHRRIGRTPVAYIRASRERVIAKIRGFERTWAVAEGRLLMADVKEDALRCRLHPSTGDPLLCTFAEDVVPLVMGHLRRFVQVRGEATIDPTTLHLRSLAIKDLEPIEELTETTISLTSLTAFWSPTTFEDLAAQQAVYPLQDWSQSTR